MIQELVNFGQRKTEGKNKAFKEEFFSIILVVDNEGNYQQFICGERQSIETEIITAKKGKARFLLDKCEEVLGVHVDINKLETFKRNLEPFKDLPEFIPIFKFYDKQNVNGLKKAIEEYINIDKEYNIGNFTFVVNNSVILATEEIQNAIKNHLNEPKQVNIKKGQKLTLTDATYSIAIVINDNGFFQGFTVSENQNVQTEAISTNNNKSLLLLGKDLDILGITKEGVGKKHQWFLDKLYQYQENLTSLQPVLKFYDNNNENGLRKAISDSVYRLDKELIGDNITFMVMDSLLLKKYDVREAIIKHYCDKERDLINGKICSICGKTNSPVVDEPHGLVKMPKGQTAGCALISYNELVFESYGLKGNLNSSICRDCARNYIEGLRCLLSEGHEVPEKEKQKAHFEYSHRINISDSTVALFWTRQETEYENPFVISNPPDESWVKRLFESVWNGENNKGTTVDTNIFYSCTLSAAAARIAVRDWTTISLDTYKKNLAEWFKDIEICKYDSLVYSPLRLLVNATQRARKPGEKQKTDTNSKSRIGAILWNAAINGRSHTIPLEVLQCVLNRIWKGETISSERAAIIKLVINRNTNKNMKSTLDEANTSLAYLCGRLFAVIESMQWKAIGKVNSSVKDKYFAAVASQPAYIFGILLTKHVPVYQHKIGGYLAKELNEIAGTISEQGTIPHRFSAIEQGEFALGYYFQKTHKTNNEIKENIN